MRYLYAIITTLCFACGAYAEDLTCPPTIETAHQKLTAEIPGWRSFVYTENLPEGNPEANQGKATRKILRIWFYQGPPEELNSMIGNLNADRTHDWVFADNGKQKYFLTCVYEQTDVQLMRELPASLKSCRASYKQNEQNMDGSVVLEKILCE